MRCAEATRFLSPLQDEFAIRYYRWSTEQCKKELASDFAKVRQVKSSLVLLFMEFVGLHTATEIEKLLTGNVKRFARQAPALIGEPISPEEEAMHVQFVNYFSEDIVIHGERFSAFRVSGEEKKLRNMVAEGRISFVTNAKQLRRALELHFEQFRLTSVHQGRSGVMYRERLGDWYLFSSFAVSGRSQVEFDCWLDARPRIDRCFTKLKANINPLNWCGVHPNTRFDLIATTEVAGVAQFLAETYQCMRDFVRSLIQGLSHQIPEHLEDAAPIIGLSGRE